jgi:hypothetical protein
VSTVEVVPESEVGTSRVKLVVVGSVNVILSEQLLTETGNGKE